MPISIFKIANIIILQLCIPPSPTKIHQPEKKNHLTKFLIPLMFCYAGQVYNYWLDLNNNKLSTREEGATEDNKYRGKDLQVKGQRLIDVKSRGQS